MNTIRPEKLESMQGYEWLWEKKTKHAEPPKVVRCGWCCEILDESCDEEEFEQEAHHDCRRDAESEE